MVNEIMVSDPYQTREVRSALEQLTMTINIKKYFVHEP